jgi:hypothetical protein
VSSFGYDAVDAAWWPFVFVLLAGWLPTDVWRWLGVASAGRFDEASPALAVARTVATSLVAAVIARLILYPTGSLADISASVRISAVTLGFAAYYWLGRQTLLAILVAEIVLLGVPWAMGSL